MSKQTYEQGVIDEQERFVKLLADLGVIRDHMFHIDYQVISTQDGPIDITWAKLLGQTK